MGRRLLLSIACLLAMPAAPASAQLFSLFTDRDVPVYCGNYSGLSWVTTLSIARAPDTNDPVIYRELLGRTARDALRAQGHAVDALPSCFFDDPALPRSNFNRPADQLQTQWQEESRNYGGARAVARLDVPVPVDPQTRPRPVPLAGALYRRMVAEAAPPVLEPSGHREILPPAAAAALLPHQAAPADTAENVRALNDAILANHAAIEEEVRRRQANFAEERRLHQQEVDAAAERERLYRAEVARLQAEEAAHQAAEAQYQRELAEYQAQLRGRRPIQPAPTRSVQQAQAVDWREAVTVCQFDTAEARTRPGHWRCVGPALANFAKVGTDVGELDPTVLGHLGSACGGTADAIRDLGTVRAYRVFGCGFGINPGTANMAQVDAAVRFGLAEIPGRNVYRCPPGQPACRTR